MAEQAEGAPLLREYRVKKLHRGFESLSHRHLLYHAPVAQLDRVLGYEPSGQRFESFRVRHLLSSNFSFYQKQLLVIQLFFSIINRF